MPVPVTPTFAQIRERAYELWERNHRPDGLEVQFWLAAERELRAEMRADLPADKPGADTGSGTEDEQQHGGTLEHGGTLGEEPEGQAPGPSSAGSS